MKESDIQRSIMTYLRYTGWFVFKIHQSLGSYKGIADLYAIKSGRAYWIEVKTDKGRLSEDQKAFKADIESHGGMFLVARSIDDVVSL